jgi:tRNA dimethylallyltransferase
MRAVEVCLQTGKKYSSLRSKPKADRSFKIIKIGLELPRENLVNRIHQRVDQMLKEGLVEEVKSLLAYKELNALNTVGYKELFKYFEGEWSYELAIEKIKTNTRRFSKRQMTWFRKDKEIKWFSPDDLVGIVEFCGE